MNIIEAKNLTKDYGHGRGIYDLSFQVAKGETLGFLGPNGAGKSTTMRHLMGFSKPQKGETLINHQSCWKEHAQIMNQVGYLPGEVTLPEETTGRDFLKTIQDLRRSNRKNRLEELIEIFEININDSIKKMSIGEKRKLAVATAFMNDPDVLLLDEPTSGLDPVMQEKFIQFVLSEKENGKTILLSSHIFSEIEALCDRIAIIKEGKLVSVIDSSKINDYNQKTFEITFASQSGFEHFINEGFDIRESHPEMLKLEMVIEESTTSNVLINVLTKYKIINFIERHHTLEEYFMHFYENNRSFGGINNG